MALAKPPELLRWSTDETNDTEPLEAKKDSGYTVNEEPSSAETNWLLRIGGEMQEYLRERVFDGLIGGGGDTEDFLITPAAPASAGGTLSIKGADAVTGIGGTVQVEAGGSVGNNINGGTAVVSAGASTGNGSSDLQLKARDAGGGAGATARPPQDYLICDGAQSRITTERRIDFNVDDTLRGPANWVPQSANPSAPAEGDVWGDANVPKLSHYDGALSEYLSRKRLVTLADGTQLVDPFPGTTSFGQTYTFPANSLRVGDVIRVIAFGEADPQASGNLNLNLVIGVTSLGVLNLAVTTSGISRHWRFEGQYVIRALGNFGTVVQSASAWVEEGTGAYDGFNSISTNPWNTTAPIVLDLQAGFGFADGSNTIDLFSFIVEVL